MKEKEMSNGTVNQHEILGKLDRLRETAANSLQTYQETMKEIASLATMASGTEMVPEFHNSHSVTSNESMKEFSNTVTESTNKNRSGATTRRRSSGPSLKSVVEETLRKTPRAIREFLPEYPASAKGLSLAELKAVILKEGRWTSDVQDIAPQIQQALFALRKSEIVVRDSESRRYHIV